VPHAFAFLANEWVTGIIRAQGVKSREGSDRGIPPFGKKRRVDAVKDAYFFRDGELNALTHPGIQVTWAAEEIFSTNLFGP